MQLLANTDAIVWCAVNSKEKNQEGLTNQLKQCRSTEMGAGWVFTHAINKLSPYQ